MFSCLLLLCGPDRVTEIYVGISSFGEILSCFSFDGQVRSGPRNFCGLKLSLREMLTTFLASFTWDRSGPRNFCGLTQSLREMFSRLPLYLVWVRSGPRNFCGLIDSQRSVKSFASFVWVRSCPRNFCGLTQSLREMFSRLPLWCGSDRAPEISVGLYSLGEI